MTEAELVADVFEAQLPGTGAINLAAGEGVDVPSTLSALNIGPGVEAFVFDSFGRADWQIHWRAPRCAPTVPGRSTLITDFLNSVWEGVSGVLSGPASMSRPSN